MASNFRVWHQLWDTLYIKKNIVSASYYNEPMYTSTGGSRGGGQPGHGPLKAQDGGHHVFWPPKSSQKVLFITFFESEFGSIPKNSGSNPWSFQFWGTLVGPAPSSPPKTGGWIRQCTQGSSSFRISVENYTPLWTNCAESVLTSAASCTVTMEALSGGPDSRCFLPCPSLPRAASEPRQCHRLYR